MFRRIYLLALIITGSSYNVTGQRHNLVKDDIYSLAKSYGYVRYFYPGDEAANIDWNRFLFYTIKRVCENKTQPLKYILNEVFQTIAPAVSVSETGSRKFNLYQEDTSLKKLKPVYWQHLGDGNGSIGFPYKSMRVNRPSLVLPESQNDFATIRKEINVQTVAGKEIEVKAFFKSDPVVNARYSVIILIKQENKEAVVISSDAQEMSAVKWCEYMVRTKIPDSAEKVTAIIQSVNMAGTTYVDDIKISVFENTKWVTLEEESFSGTNLQLVKSKWKPSGINQDFGVEKKDGNECFKIERTQGKKIITEQLFRDYPAEHILLKPIGLSLQLQLPVVLYGDSIHTYPVANEYAGKKLAERLEEIQSTDFTSENLYCRLTNVILLWNKIQHFYPEMKRLKINWDAMLRQAIEASFHDNNVSQHRQTLTKMLSALKDGHMTLYYTSLMPPNYFPPVSWEWVQGKLVITAVMDTTLPVSRGDIVVSVNGTPASRLWQNAMQNVLGATEARRRYKAINESISGEKNTELKLEIEAGNKRLKVIKVKRTLTETFFEKQSSQTTLSSFAEITPGIYYMNLNRITWSDLKARIKELERAVGIIIDVRRYPQWQTINILSHFICQPVSRLQYGIPVITYPDQERMKIQYDTAIIIYPQQPFIKAKKIFLTGGGAISYAEDVIAVADYYKIGDIAGEPTAGTTGGTNICYLAGGLYTSWTGMTVLKQNGSLFNTIGVIPGHKVARTIKDIREGKDTVLEYALVELKKQ